MISSTCTSAPAGARGPVFSAVPATGHPVGSPVAARLRALPVAVGAAPRPGTPVPGTRVFEMPVIDALGATGDAQQIGTCTTEHNGTTLGIHSSGRPSS